jgi:hypothetical protein
VGLKFSTKLEPGSGLYEYYSRSHRIKMCPVKEKKYAVIVSRDVFSTFMLSKSVSDMLDNHQEKHGKSGLCLGIFSSDDSTKLKFIMTLK